MTLTQSPIRIMQLDNGQEESFYVPAFEVHVEGRNLPGDVVRDVMEVTYRDNVNEIDSFELRINNWDAGAQAFKYTGIPNELAKDAKKRPDMAGIFEPGQEVKIFMGYRGAAHKDNLRLMIEGQITTLAPDFPASGGPTLAVSGLNVLHTFRKKQHTWSWADRTDSQIAEEIGSLPLSDNRPGLKMRVAVDSEVKDKETKETFVFMNNQYDIIFLLERARRHGYSLYLNRDEKGERYLKYGYVDAARLRDVTYRLEWGISLIQFKPTLTTTNQISQVTVRGWDRKNKKPIVATAKMGEKGLEINDDQRAVAKAVQGKEEVITDRPVHTQQEAERMAQDILRNQLKEMVTASGSTLGLPDLRAGRKVVIEKLGQRFSGVYFITTSTHTINNSGYVTTFEARREEGLPGEP
jgi:uncharacterized protein